MLPIGRKTLNISYFEATSNSAPPPLRGEGRLSMHAGTHTTALTGFDYMHSGQGVCQRGEAAKPGQLHRLGK